MIGMHLRRRPTLALNSALAALTLAGIGLAYYTIAGSDDESTTAGQSQRSVAVTQGTVTSSVSASGTIGSASTASASFGTSGTVTEIDVKVGDVVTKDQLLAKVDPASANDTLGTARANLTAAQQALARAQSNSSDAATIASLTAQVTKADAAVATAQRSVDGTVLTAPIGGTVIAVNGSVGSTAGSSGGSSGSGSGAGSGSGSGGASGGTGGSTSSTGSSGSSSGFIQLADLTSLQVSASFAEADATKLKAGQPATVTWSALSGARATGKVSTIAPTATSSNNVNTYAVVATLDNAPDGARIGQSATIAVTVAEVANVLRLPVSAVTTAGNRHTVTVKSGTATQTRAVEVGVQGNQYVEITSGVSLGDTVVIVVKVSTSGSSGTTRFNGPGGGFGGDIPGGGMPGGGAPGGGR